MRRGRVKPLAKPFPRERQPVWSQQQKFLQRFHEKRQSETIDPTLDLQFAAKQVLDSRIAFARTGTAMVTGSDGLLGFAPHNLLVYSNTFDHASWGDCFSIWGF